MQVPLNHDEPTGRPKRIAAMLILLLIVGGTLAYAASLPDRKAAVATDSANPPQVQGQKTDSPAESNEFVLPEDAVQATTSTADIPASTYRITSTVDGDTVKASINGKIETIRLIGVDTPETKDPRKNVQCFGQAASDFTKANLLGKDVRLAPDASQDNRDKYGRLLRYIFLADGTNFNEQLVASGYAYEYTYYVPYKYQKQFKADQASAEAGQKGLWSPATCSGKR